MLTPRRIRLWGTAIFVLSWALYVHAMATPGYVDRVGRFKGTDFVQFYVMGALVLEGRTSDLYDGAAHLEAGRRLIDPTLALYAANPNYGPQVAAAFVPLAMLSYGWALTLFLAMMAGCYGLSVGILYRECPALAGHGRLVAVLAAGSPLFLAGVRYGQLSAVSLLFFTLTAVALRRSRPVLAGMFLGCLAFKPQLGLVAALVILLSHQWRIASGALLTTMGQLAVGWVVDGTRGLAEYGAVLWRLLRDPSLVQLFPSEVHSLRGFLQLLLSSPTVVAAGALAGLAVAVIVGWRCWTSAAPVKVRWAQILLLTILAAPHLLSYDLLLLTLPLLVMAEWSVRHVDHPLRPAVAVLLVLLYVSPFSSSLARLIAVQLSVLAMIAAVWCVYRICVEADAPEAVSVSPP